MRLLSLTLVSALLLLTLASAAVAGSPDDPDLTDPCGEPHLTTDPVTGTPISHVAPWLDLAAGWLDLADDLSTLTVSLQTCGDAPAAHPQNLVEGQLTVRWKVGECRQAVQFWEHDADGVVLNGNSTEHRVEMSQTCPTSQERLVLDDALVQRDGDVVTWTLPMDGSLSPFTDLLTPTVEAPIVLTQLEAQSSYHLALQGYAEGDDTEFGRAVVLKHD